MEIYGNGNVEIAQNCDLGPNVKFITGSHEMGTYNRRAGKGKTFNYTIGKGTWIGADSIISNGAVIESGVVIGAASLVTKRCDKNCLYYGIPAKKIKEL